MCEKNMRKFCSIIIFLSLVSLSAYSEDLRHVSFMDACRLALKNSPQIISQKYITDSAYDKASAQKLKRLPTLNLNAESMFISKVGQITIPALGVNNTVGSHTNWSVSPTLDFIVWDTGEILKRAKSLKKSAEAKSDTIDFDKRQVLLGARSSYVGVQLAKEQVGLVTDALKLAKAQYAYILDRYKTGTSDKFDLTVAHQEMVDREKDLEEAYGELSVSKRALAAALAIEEEIENAESMDVEPMQVSLDFLVPRSNASFEVETHPQVKALANQASSSEWAAKSIVTKYFPTVKLRGSAGYEYPNLGQNITVQQNTLTLNLQMPILEWGRIWKETKSEKHQAKALDEQRKQTMIDLTRDVAETRDWIGTYKKLQIADVAVVKDAVEVAALSFDSYKAGRVIFLDVQRANVKALQAKVNAARNDATLAVYISKLLALAKDEGDLNEK